MIRRVVVGAAAAAASAVAVRALARRGAERLLSAPRTGPGEAALAPALDALGGEVVRLRSRDGLRLAARWLPAARPDAVEHEADGTATATAPGSSWRPDPHEAIVLLHGWTGSSVPFLVEDGPFLRHTAGVLAVDFRGHGGSDPAPTTFGLTEVEDVAGALSWLGERGIERVALLGRSMGGGTALAAVAVLGDGSMPGVDADPAAPAHVAPPRRPRVVAIVAESVAPEIAVPIRSRLRGPARGLVARWLLDAAAGTLGGDPRELEPARVIGLLEGIPLLLISGAADSTVPIADARRLAAAAPDGTTHWIVPGADHGRAHEVDPRGYEARVTDHLRAAFASARGSGPIIGAPGERSADAPDPAGSVED